MDRKQARAYLKGFAMLAVLAGLGLGLRAAGLDQALDEHWIDAHIRGQGLWGWGLFLLAAGAFTGLGLPRQIVAFLGGYAYGFLGGTLAGTLGTALGCALAFFFARFLGRGYVARRFGGKIAKVDAFLRENPFSMTLIIRFMPVGSNILTNLVAGVSSVGALPFLAGSTLGFVPQTLIFALLGSGFKVDFAWRVTLAAILFVLSTWWGFVLYRKKRASTVLNGD
ncbi:TVP38/TMEM64 family protein [Desulfocurvus sp. DL9XJH121]